MSNAEAFPVCWFMGIPRGFPDICTDGHCCRHCLSIAVGPSVQPWADLYREGGPGGEGELEDEASCSLYLYPLPFAPHPSGSSQVGLGIVPSPQHLSAPDFLFLAWHKVRRAAHVPCMLSH
jgi:hypothetical protein